MEINEFKTGDLVIVTLSGRLDAGTAEGVQSRLTALMEGGSRKLLLDLGGLDYIASVGLRVFMLMAKQLQSEKGEFAFCSLQSQIRQVFEISGFDSIFAMYDTKEAALEVLQ